MWGLQVQLEELRSDLRVLRIAAQRASDAWQIAKDHAGGSLAFLAAMDDLQETLDKLEDHRS